MSKDNREIVGAVRIGKTTFRSGQEDELAAAASSDEIARLADRGVITGDFSSGKKASKSADVETEESVPTDETPTTDKAPATKGKK